MEKSAAIREILASPSTGVGLNLGDWDRGFGPAESACRFGADKRSLQEKVAERLLIQQKALRRGRVANRREDLEVDFGDCGGDLRPGDGLAVSEIMGVAAVTGGEPKDRDPCEQQHENG